MIGLVGTPEKIGPVVSFTMTVNDAEPVSPPESVAVHVTVFVPIANVLPDIGEQVTVAIGAPCQSLALAVKVTVAPAIDVASTVMFAGTVTTGGPQPGIAASDGQVSDEPLHVSAASQTFALGRQTRPATTAVHAPSLLPPAATEQAWQSLGLPPPHALAQQTPSTQ
jgi:hypothetical protein